MSFCFLHEPENGFRFPAPTPKTKQKGRQKTPTHTNSDIMLLLPLDAHAPSLATQMTMFPYRALWTLMEVLTRARSFRALCRDRTALSASGPYRGTLMVLTRFQPCSVGVVVVVASLSVSLLVASLVKTVDDAPSTCCSWLSFSLSSSIVLAIVSLGADVGVDVGVDDDVDIQATGMCAEIERGDGGNDATVVNTRASIGFAA
jgi:hypothetical protein